MSIIFLASIYIYIYIYIERERERDLLSIFNGTLLPSMEGSQVLVKESSTCSSFSTIILKLVPLILHAW
jgi:hypothetical protein